MRFAITFAFAMAIALPSFAQGARGTFVGGVGHLRSQEAREARAAAPAAPLPPRQFDESDPEMQAIMRSLVRPCPTMPDTPCDVRAEFRAPGQRLVDYLISNFEVGVELGHFPNYAIFDYLAYTGDDFALTYLEDKAMNDPSARTRGYALRGLAKSRDPSTLDVIVGCLETDAGLDTQGQIHAVEGIRRLVLQLREEGSDHPGAVAALRARSGRTVGRSAHSASIVATPSRLNRHAEKALTEIEGGGR